MTSAKNSAMTSANHNLVLTERADEIRVKQCLSLLKSRNNFKQVFFNKKCFDEYGNEIVGNKKYLDNIEYYLNILKENNYELKVGYSPSQNDKNKTGRLYAKMPISQQYLIATVKNYITKDIYHDYDIVNCIPTLLVEFIERNNISCSYAYLKNYILDRETIFNEWGLEKLDIIKVINCDKNYRKNGNNWYNQFIQEMENIKKSCIDLIEVPKDNEKNPISRGLVKELKKDERKIVDALIEFIGKDKIAVPMFDGVNSYIECDIKAFTKKIRKELGFKYISLIEKPLDCIDDLDVEVDSDIEYETYDKIKVEFEKVYFKTNNPLAYWRKLNSGEIIQISRTDLQDEARTYKYYYIDEGKKKITNIWSKWLEDPNKRCYETIDNIMFIQKEFNQSKEIFNIAKPYLIHNYENPKLVNIDNFIRVCENVGGNIEANTNFLIKLLAMLVMNPNKLPQILLISEGFQGVGKTTIPLIIGKIIGKNRIKTITSLDKLSKNNKEVMMDSKIVIGEEIKHADMKSNYNILKDLCTNDTITITEKYEKQFDITNNKLFWINTNYTPSIEAGCRRSVLLTPSFDLKHNVSFWNKIYKDMEEPNWVYSVYKYLELNYDDSFNPSQEKNKVENSILDDLKEMSISPQMKFIIDMIDTEKDLTDDIQNIQETFIKLLKEDKLTVNDVHRLWIAYWFEATNKPLVGTLTTQLKRFGPQVFDVKGKRLNGKFSKVYKIYDMKKLLELCNSMIYG